MDAMKNRKKKKKKKDGLKGPWETTLHGRSGRLL